MTMKRGLSTRDVDRAPAQRYHDRVEALRGRARAAGAEAVLVYGDVSSGGAIAYLAHATIYWGNAIFYVPVDGPTTLVMSSSPRIRDWFAATGVLQEQASGAQLDRIVAELVNTGRLSTVGIADLGGFPAAYLSGLRSRTEADFVDLGPVVRGPRTAPGPAELADLVQCAELVRSGIAAAEAALSTGDSAAVQADGEYAMRMLGAWDATVPVQATAAPGFFVQYRGQLRDAWYGAERTYPAEPRERATGVQAAFDAVIASARAGVPVRELTERAEAACEALAEPPAVDELVVEGVTEVEFPAIEPAPEAVLRDGSVVHIVLRAWDADGAIVAGTGDTYLVRPDRLVPLLDLAGA